MSGKVATLIALAVCLAGTADAVKAADHWLEKSIKDTPIETAKIQWDGVAGQEACLYYFQQCSNNMRRVKSVDCRNLDELLTDFPVSNDWRILQNGSLPNEDEISITPSIFLPSSIFLIEHPENTSVDIMPDPGFVRTDNSNPSAVNAMMLKIIRNNLVLVYEGR